MLVETAKYIVKPGGSFEVFVKRKLHGNMCDSKKRWNDALIKCQPSFVTKNGSDSMPRVSI